jgi:hypothetical protein
MSMNARVIRDEWAYYAIVPAALNALAAVIDTPH